MRWPALTLCLIVVGSACTAEPSRVFQRKVTSALSELSELTALGDSVPHGTACSCTPYPELSGARHTSNDARPGFTTADVMVQLQDDPVAIEHVEKADAVIVEIGANDIAFTPACGTLRSCYELKLPQVARNIRAIVDRVRLLTAPRAVPVVLLDYWNVWLGGRVGIAQGPEYVNTADALSDELGKVIDNVSQATKSTYVDLRSAFRGADHDEDETNLLAADGDHPNANGHSRIAQAIAQAVDAVPTRA